MSVQRIRKTFVINSYQKQFYFKLLYTTVNHRVYDFDKKIKIKDEMQWSSVWNSELTRKLCTYIVH